MRHHRLTALRITLILMLFGLDGCAMHYSGMPASRAEVRIFEATNPVSFKVHDPSFAGDGPQAVIDTLRVHSYFGNAQQIQDLSTPQEGVFVEVNPNYRPPSDMSLLFGYISLATLTFVPALSTEDGFDVSYRLFRDGKLIRQFDYDTRRYIGLWLGLLPFMWVNALTTGEAEIFRSFTEQFLVEAEPLLAR
jgi:hypothetical protein